MENPPPVICLNHLRFFQLMPSSLPAWLHSLTWPCCLIQEIRTGFLFLLFFFPLLGPLFPPLLLSFFLMCYSYFLLFPKLYLLAPCPETSQFLSSWPHLLSCPVSTHHTYFGKVCVYWEAIYLFIANRIQFAVALEIRQLLIFKPSKVLITTMQILLPR